MKLLLLMLCMGTLGCARGNLQPPLDANYAYQHVQQRMDARLGTLTEKRATERWGQPQARDIDGDYLRLVWHEPKYPFPDVPKPANPTVAARFNYSAVAGSFDWPINTQLIMWFDETGHLHRYEIVPLGGTIYTDAHGKPLPKTP